MTNYRKINYDVMADTVHQCETNRELLSAVKFSIQHQYIVRHEDSVAPIEASEVQSHHIVTGKRSFEAAKAYTGKKVAVLNFANNHNIGGSPYTAEAQEESLCRCSTLYPCLCALTDSYYHKHLLQLQKRQMDYMGNDDLIYTPDVVVFKSDERTDPIIPQTLPQEEWYKVDVITMAAPELFHYPSPPVDYEPRITSRIRKILDIAAKEGVEVLILGAWGCGAFQNPADVVARIFRELLKDYHFEVVEFALATNSDPMTTEFGRAFAL